MIDWDFFNLSEIPNSHFDEFKSFDEVRSGFFWERCSKNWEVDKSQKIHVMLKLPEKKVLGYFSILANNFSITHEKLTEAGFNFFPNPNRMNIPFIDVSFIGISNDLSEDQKSKILSVILEKINELSFEISEKVACRFIRCYIPKKKIVVDGKETPEFSLLNFFEDKFLEYLYVDPPISNEMKERLYSKPDNPRKKIFMKYYLRDLRIQN